MIPERTCFLPKINTAMSLQIVSGTITGLFGSRRKSAVNTATEMDAVPACIASGILLL